MFYYHFQNCLLYEDEFKNLIFNNFNLKGYFLALNHIDVEKITQNLDSYNFKISSFNIEIKNQTKTKLIHLIKDLTNLKDSEDLLKSVDGKKRNQIRKSLKYEYIAKNFLLDENYLLEFYEFYKLNMQRHSTIPKPLTFFEEFLKLKPRIFELRDGEKIVAINFVLECEKVSHVMFNLSDTDYWKQNINDRIYFETFNYYIEKEFNYFDFGPSVVNDLSHIEYKLQWNTTVYDILEFKKVPFLKGLILKINEFFWRVKSRVYKMRHS